MIDLNLCKHSTFVSKDILRTIEALTGITCKIIYCLKGNCLLDFVFLRTLLSHRTAADTESGDEPHALAISTT